MRRLPQPLLRAAVILSMTAVGLLAILLAGALTNWFRYGLSLESEFVLVPAVLLIVAVLIIHGWALRTIGRNNVALFAAAAALVFAGAITGVAMKQAFGSWVPTLALNDADRNGEQVIHISDGASVVYHLELLNPFASNARAYLVGTMGGRFFKVALPVGRLGGYGEALAPSDWVTLTPTSSRQVFLAQVTVDPGRKHTFAVDLERGIVLRTQ